MEKNLRAIHNLQGYKEERNRQIFAQMKVSTRREIDGCATLARDTT